MSQATPLMYDEPCRLVWYVWLANRRLFIFDRQALLYSVKVNMLAVNQANILS